MKLFYLAVLLTVLQTASPIPEQTTDNSARATQKANEQSKLNQTPAPKSQPLINPEARPQNRDAGEAVINQNTQQSVRISEWPPVLIPKGWADYTYWVFSLCLVIVGALQVWLLWGTLGAIKRQADSMEKTAQNAAKEVILLNRAYLTVDNWMEQDNSGIKFRIYNPSKTAARIEGIEHTIMEKTTAQTHGFMLTPQESQWVGIAGDVLPRARIENHRVIPVVFVIQGQVIYRDIFKKVRHRTFARTCTRDLDRINFSIPEGVLGANDEKEWDNDES